MSCRTKSRVQQWIAWLCAALVGLAVYVVLSRILYGSMSWNIVLPRNQRIVLPILALFWLFAWESRWDGKRREEGTGEREQGREGGSDVQPVGACLPCESEPRRGGCGGVACRVRKGSADSNLTRQTAASTEETNLRCTPNTCTSASSSDDATGEELYAKARGMKHQPIPDFDNDGPYLELLNQSAVKGHAPALAKLGEYAMRRRAWVEAYYWMKQAQRSGMHGLSSVLREIRGGWGADGFPRQSSNVSMLFSKEAGRLGRALLRFDSGHEEAKAKEFLKANHPEFL